MEDNSKKTEKENVHCECENNGNKKDKLTNYVMNINL